MPPISVLMKPSSSLCNMSCDYCFYCDEASKRSIPSYGWMSESTLKNVIRRTLLRAEGSISYAFQGGEPTLRGLEFFEKVIAYEKQYNKNHISISNALQTNGYALDENWCRFLKDNHFLVGLSVDGTETTHNTYRHDKSGHGTYSHVRKAAALMDQYQVDYNILTVVTADTAANIREIYDHYRNLGWHYQQYIACLDPLGEEHGSSPYSLSPARYGQFLIDLFQLWYHDLKKGRQPYIRTFENYVALAVGYMPESCEQRGICGLQYVVEADGSVYPCDFYMLDSYCIGNFNEDRLDAIDKNREKLQFIQRSRNLSDDCLSCPHYRLCRGGCQRNRDFHAGSGQYTNYFCEGYRMFFDACSDKIMEIAKNLVPDKPL